MAKPIRFMVAMMALIVAVSVDARDFTYQGIVYTVQDEETKTCHTKAGTAGFMQAPVPGNSVSGELVIPAQVSDGDGSYTVVGLGNLAFYGCTGLTKADMPATVTSIGTGAFSGCTGLTTIDIPAGVTEIEGSVFSDCIGLTGIDLPDAVTRIGSYAFEGCTGLATFGMPAGVTGIGSYAFKGCTALTGVDLPAGLTLIEEGVFSGCTGLTSIEIPSGVTEIGVSAFQNCTGMERVVIPASVVKLGDVAFSGAGLTSVDIPAAEVGSHCFWWCAKLTTATLGRLVPGVGERAFESTPLTDLYSFSITPPAAHAQTFVGEYPTVILHVTPEAKEAYANDEYWGKFWNIVTDISAGIDDVGVDELLEPEHYYNLQGQPVDAARMMPEQIYIKRFGTRSAKVLVR